MNIKDKLVAGLDMKSLCQVQHYKIQCNSINLGMGRQMLKLDRGAGFFSVNSPENKKDKKLYLLK